MKLQSRKDSAVCPTLYKTVTEHRLCAELSFTPLGPGVLCLCVSVCRAAEVRELISGCCPTTMRCTCVLHTVTLAQVSPLLLEKFPT